MKKYFDTVLDERTGNAIESASVLVKDLQGNEATIYSDNSSTVAVNPLTTDSNGYFEFYAKDGRYSLTISKTGKTTRTISDVLIEEGNCTSISALRGLPVPTASGDSIDVLGYTTAGDGGGGTFYWDSASTDADDAGITILPTGHTGAGRWKRKYEGEINVKWFGATGDGTTDDTTAIQAAVTYVEAAGGGTLFVPAGTYIISTTISVDDSNVLLDCAGGDDTHSVGTFGENAGTIFKWNGAAGGTMFYFSSPSGASSQKKIGGGIHRAMLHSNYPTNTAGIGIRVTSMDRLSFDGLMGYEFTTGFIQLDTHASGTLGDDENVQQCEFKNISGRQVQAGGAFMILDGNAAANRNTSMNYFENCDVTFDGLTGTGAYSLRDCDNNLFVRCRAYCSSGTGDAVVFYAASDSGYARDNIFVHFSSGNSGAIVAQGTGTAANYSRNNTMLLLDTGNATPAPTVGTSATIAWSTTNRRIASHGFQSAAFGDDTTATQAAQNNIGSESVRIHNSGANHMRLVSATDEWGIDVNGTDLRVRRVSGTGSIQVNNDTKFVAKAGFNNTAPIAKPTVTGSRGGNAALASLLTELANYGLITDSSTA